MFSLVKNYIVYGCSRSLPAISSVNYHHAQLDVSERITVRGWIRAVECFEKIDLLVCNAGYPLQICWWLWPPVVFLIRCWRTNIAGSFFVSGGLQSNDETEVWPNHHDISMGRCLHEEGTSAYSCLQSAIVEMTKYWLRNLPPSHYCNVIAPSILMTDAVHSSGEEIIQKSIKQVNNQRVVTIEEICNVISFLSMRESNCITGQVIHLGLVCWKIKSFVRVYTYWLFNQLFLTGEENKTLT